MGPEWEQKIWGKVSHLVFEGGMASLLDVKHNFRCSIHHHRYRHNSFLCLTASLEIVFYRWDTVAKTPIPYRSSIIIPGEVCTAYAGQWHSFTALSNGIVVEGYWTTDGTPVDPDDIVRYDVGGLV